MSGPVVVRSAKGWALAGRVAYERTFVRERGTVQGFAGNPYKEGAVTNTVAGFRTFVFAWLGAMSCVTMVFEVVQITHNWQVQHHHQGAQVVGVIACMVFGALVGVIASK